MTRDPNWTDPQWRKPPRRAFRASWAPALAVWCGVFVLVWLIARPGGESSLLDPAAEARPVAARGELGADELNTIGVFQEASASVVYITSLELARDFFFNAFEVPRGTGSGFVYDQEGHIVTNVHVLADGTRYRVTLADGSEWDAAVVGSEPDRDLAVLKINAPSEQCKPIKLGTSRDLQVGQKVLAIGNPFGFDQTLTIGVVSALGREIRSLTGRKIHDVIQTDAAINPGNSGGPLLDSGGRLVGVNTQIASPSGANVGIGFAVPVDIVNDVVSDIIRYGRVLRPTLGVKLVSERWTRRLGIRRGLLIESVLDNTGAARANLRGTQVDERGYIRRLGDIIIEVAQKRVDTLNELKDVLEPFKDGDEVDVKLARDDKVLTIKVRLQYLR